jgi:hypothetical protein
MKEVKILAYIKLEGGVRGSLLITKTSRRRDSSNQM